MITRRGFLLGGATATASGIVLPSFFERALAHVDNHGAPLLEPASGADELLFASFDGVDSWVLSLGEPLTELPVMTYEELWTEQYGSFEQGVQEHIGYTQEELAAETDPEVLEAILAEIPPRDGEVDPSLVLESIDTPEAEAFHLLSSLDLGPWDGYDKALGDLTFWDGPCPGNDYRGVHAQSDLALSCLQHRLNALGTGIAVRLL